MGKSQPKNNTTKTRKDGVSHLQARRDDDGVKEDQRWALEMKDQAKNNKMEAHNNGALGFEWEERRR